MILINRNISYNLPNRHLIVGANNKIPLGNGNLVTSINFDNAATTPALYPVLEEVNNFIPWYSSIHRGTGYKSKLSSELYEKSREVIKKFVNADLKNDTVIYVKNTTEAINKLSYRLLEKSKKNIILSSYMEHHSNILPWRKKYNVFYIDLDENGRLSLNDLEFKLKKYKGRVKLVTVTGASNVTGYINPIHKIAQLSHKYGAKILIDGAQLIPHYPIDMNHNNYPNNIDYLVFSSHKMYAPFGIGVLIGPKSTFEKGDPEYTGGGTVEFVTPNYVKWIDPPSKEEAGSPNIIGVIALTSAIKTLNKVGMHLIHKYENKLTEYTVSILKKIPDVQLYCNFNNNLPYISVIPFNIKDIPHDVVSKALSLEAGIAVRSGCFCAQPYIQRLLKIPDKKIDFYIQNPNLPRPGMVRISFGSYNIYPEIHILTQMIRQIVLNKKYYLEKYQ